MPKIMLVEDDHTMYSLLKTLMQMEGFQIVQQERETMEDIMSAMRKEHPEAILLDVNLHTFNGIDLLNQIRSDPEIQDTYVLMSSGMDYSEECRKNGANDFILKPYMPDDLIDRLRKATEQ